MLYYEVLIADGRYHSDAPLTYSSDKRLDLMSVVTIPLRQKTTTGFVLAETKKPRFAAKPIKAVVSSTPLPAHCLELAKWLQSYYACSLAEALRQFAPVRPSVVRKQPVVTAPTVHQTEWKAPLTADQAEAVSAIGKNPSTTILLHGETGTGKTRVYLELAKKTLADNRSFILLTPEISLTTQLAGLAERYLQHDVYVLHSQLSESARKKIWFAILEAPKPVVIVGARSALFSPVKNPGLIVVDEAHEPAYKQDQSPRYQTTRVASQLGLLTKAKVILGTATPLITDYYLADQKRAVVMMTQLAAGDSHAVKTSIVDIKKRSNFSRSPYLSNTLIDAVNTTLSAKKQIIIYLNRRGSARIILCNSCGWRLLCPNCDISLVYHADSHLARCHTCGYSQKPTVVCPQCSNPDIIYRSIGTKALSAEVERLFPSARIRRFDSDNLTGEHLHETYADILSGKTDILVGTQLLAKGLDLPRLGLVGIVAAETSLGLPDFTAEERTLQLLYQVIGRVGRGHGRGEVVIQSAEPDNLVIQAAAKRDWPSFYSYGLGQRRSFKFPPFSYLMQLVCARTSAPSAEAAAEKLKRQLLSMGLKVEIMGPAPTFYARRGRYFYYQLVIKAKNRSDLLNIAKTVPSGWRINIDPADLL